MNLTGNSANSSPAAATPAFSPFSLNVTPASPGQFTLQFPGVAGRNYIIQVSTNLITWTPVSTNQPSGGVLIFTDTNASGPARFYRVMQ